MRFWLKVTSAPTIELPEYAAFAEELGFEGLMIGEHLLQPPASHAASNVAQKTPSIYPYGDGVPTWNPQMNRPDPWVAFAACASVTERLRFCSDVSIPTHEAISWAKTIATTATLAPGRVVFGLGVGWMQEEFAATGYSFSRRGQTVDGLIEMMTKLWDGGTISVDVGLGDVEMRLSPPLPPSRIPVMIGGHSPAAFRRAARHSGWLGAEVVLDELAATVTAIEKEREAIGREGPFEIIVALAADQHSADAYLRAEENGVTGINVNIWDFATNEARQERFTQLRAFAEQHIHSG